MGIQFRELKSGDEGVLARVAPDVFDNPTDEHLTVEFLEDPRHHLVVARQGNLVVGFASAVHYIHPDKPAELWINEVGVAPTHRRHGIARGLLRLLLAVGRREGCRSAWVLAERSNAPAIQLYASCGGTEAEDETVMLSFDLDGC